MLFNFYDFVMHGHQYGKLLMWNLGVDSVTILESCQIYQWWLASLTPAHTLAFGQVASLYFSPAPRMPGPSGEKQSYRIANLAFIMSSKSDLVLLVIFVHLNWENPMDFISMEVLQCWINIYCIDKRNR